MHCAPVCFLGCRALGFHFLYKLFQHLGLLRQLCNGVGGVAHGLCRFGRDGGNLLYRLVDLVAGGRAGIAIRILYKISQM